ncbi:NUDIX domain protein, partial [Rhizoctonia solani AG-3 Rhs1AP]
MARIEDQSFWMKLAELKLYLEPLAIAANVSQAPTTRLDHVLIELGRLYYTFSKFAFNPAIIKCVLESLERRWGKADQDAFILAVFLNPFIRARLFNPRNTLLNRWGLYGIVKRVFRRVFRQENDLELHEAFNDYYESRNEFHPDRWPYEEVQASCDRTGKPFNMLEVWTGILPYNAPNAGRHQLAYLATHILSIVANSAGCERLFSEMGNIHTKRRNRLAYNKVFDTAVVRMDLKRKHAAEGLTRSRLKRQFGPQKIEPAFSPVVSASQIDQNDEAAEEIADVDMMDEDPGIDFRAVAAQLRQDVLDDEDPSDDEELPPADSITNPRSLEGLRPKRVRLFFGTRVAIELKELFDYETGDDKEGLGFFKQAGLVNLEKELEIYNLSTRELEEGIEYASLLLTTRSKSLRSHPGQVALPGGRCDPGDGSMVNTAIREAHEEVGLAYDHPHVHVLTTLAPFISQFRLLITPIIAWATSSEFMHELKANEKLVHQPGVLSRPLAEKNTEGWPYESDVYEPYDREWMRGTHYRMHRFRSVAVPVKGLTAGILIYTAELAYNRQPPFSIKADDQLDFDTSLKYVIEDLEAKQAAEHKQLT